MANKNNIIPKRIESDNFLSEKHWRIHIIAM